MSAEWVCLRWKNCSWSRKNRDECWSIVVDEEKRRDRCPLSIDRSIGAFERIVWEIEKKEKKIFEAISKIDFENWWKWILYFSRMIEIIYIYFLKKKECIYNVVYFCKDGKIPTSKVYYIVSNIDFWETGNSVELKIPGIPKILSWEFTLRRRFKE